MKNKEQLLQELHEVGKKLHSLKSAKREAIKQLENEKYLPLIEHAENVKRDINNSVSEIYKDELTALSESEESLNKAIDDLKIIEADNLWHPAGTKVTLWKAENGWYSKTVYEKTSTTGIVVIYDGTQEIPANMRSWSAPKKGDVVVFYNKKDGTMGLKFDVICDYGRLKNYFPMWLAEGETPTDNIKTRLIEK